MKCPIETGETAETLLAYASRKLDAGTAAVLEKHMEICPACREFAAGQRAVWEALDVWEAEPVSSDFDRRLYRRIAERVSWWELLIRPLRPAIARRFVAVAAVACTVLLASLLLDRPAGPPPAPAAAQVEAVQPDQVEHALDDLDMLAQFERSVRADGASPRI